MSLVSTAPRRLGSVYNDPILIVVTALGLLRLVIPETVIEGMPGVIGWSLSYSGWAALSSAAAAVAPWLTAGIPKEGRAGVFWALWSGALTIWALNWIIYSISSGMVRDVVTDIAWGAGSGMLLVALNLRPHEIDQSPGREARDLTNMVAAAALTCGMLLYFVGVSAVVVPSEYRGGVPSYYLYALLDTVLLAVSLKFWASSRGSDQGRWSPTYAILGITFAWSLLTGIVELWGVETPRIADAFWYPTILGFLAAGRGRLVAATGNPSDQSTSPPRHLQNQTSPGLLITLVFLTPVAHILLTLGGNLDPAGETLRGTVAVGLGIALFCLAAVRYRLATEMWGLTPYALQWLPRVPGVLEGLNRMGLGVLVTSLDGRPLVSDGSWGLASGGADRSRRLGDRLRPLIQAPAQPETRAQQVALDVTVVLEDGDEPTPLTIVRPGPDAEVVLVVRWDGEARDRWMSSSGELLLQRWAELLEELAAELVDRVRAASGPDGGPLDLTSDTVHGMLSPVALGHPPQDITTGITLADIVRSSRPDLAVIEEDSVRVDADAFHLKAILASVLDPAFEPAGIAVQELYLDRVTASELGARAPGTFGRVSARMPDHPALEYLVTRSFPASADLTTIRLLLADRALRRVGGSVTVESVAGDSEKILTVLVPAGATSGAEPHPSTGMRDDDQNRADDDANGSGPTVLLVDDDPDLRDTLEMCVRSFGFTAKVADSGEQALELLEGTDDIAVVLTDQDMTGMSGTALLSHIRQLSDDLPVVLMTGHLSDGTVDPNTRPFDAVLPKPFKLDELERCLRELTARPAS